MARKKWSVLLARALWTGLQISFIFSRTSCLDWLCTCNFSFYSFSTIYILISKFNYLYLCILFLPFLFQFAYTVFFISIPLVSSMRGSLWNHWHPLRVLDTGRKGKILLIAKRRRHTELVEKNRERRSAVSKHGDRGGSGLGYGRQLVPTVFI